MKKNLTLTLLSLSTIVLVSCVGSSSISSSEASSEVNLWNFSETDGSRRILAEWTSHRTFDVGENGDFEPTDLLNPTQFNESSSSSSSESGGSSESSSSSSEAIDYSDEVISFSNTQDETLKNAVSALPNGALSFSDCQGLIGVLDTNDEFITRSSLESTETILYYNYLYASYSDDFNYHRTENFESKRYDNGVAESVGVGDIFYKDGYTIDFTAKEQVYGDGFNVYFLHKEYFPRGLSSHVENYKLTTPREEGSLKTALIVGGGKSSKAWLTRYAALYADYTNPESPEYNAAYTFDVSGTKTATEATISFTSQRDEYVDPVDGIYYDMVLNYEVTITDGVVTAIDTYQRYTTSAD